LASRGNFGHPPLEHCGVTVTIGGVAKVTPVTPVYGSKIWLVKLKSKVGVIVIVVVFNEDRIEHSQLLANSDVDKVSFLWIMMLQKIM